MKSRILIIGASGQLGGALSDVFQKNKNFELILADKIISKNVSFLDITKKKQVLNFFLKTKPQVVILLAAFTNVDYCEERKKLADAINVKGVENIILATRKVSSKLIFLSSAYIFDGKKGNYSENDKPNPINYYGKTKLKAEKIIQRELKDFLIIRTIWIFDLGYDKTNFVVRLLENLKQKKSIRVPIDQYGNPTLARNIAWAIEELIENNKQGIYNIVGKDKMSKYQFAVRVAKFFNLNHKLIIPVFSKDLGQKAIRPKKDNLCINKIKKELKTKMMLLDEALKFIK